MNLPFIYRIIMRALKGRSHEFQPRSLQICSKLYNFAQNWTVHKSKRTCHTRISLEAGIKKKKILCLSIGFFVTGVFFSEEMKLLVNQRQRHETLLRSSVSIHVHSFLALRSKERSLSTPLKVT